jgi:hypothetical protein
MARPKTTTALKPKTVLTKPREVFRNELLDRIKIGEELFNKPVTDLEQLSQLNREVFNWEDYNGELVKRSFNNQHSEYFDEYSRLNTMAGLMDYMKGVNTEHPSYKIKQVKEGIENSFNWLKRLVEKLPLIEEDLSITPYLTKEKAFYNRCFIVHGHDDAKKYEILRFVETDLKRKATILHEQPNKGRTIIEKF